MLEQLLILQHAQQGDQAHSTAHCHAAAAANHAECTTGGHRLMVQQMLIKQHAQEGPQGHATAKIHIFTESVPRPIHSGICNFHVYVCMGVCPK